MVRQAAVLAVLLAAAVRDARTRTIPNAYPVMAATCCLIPPVTASPGGVVAALPLFVAAILTGGVGGGDVKLVAALGLALGFERTVLIEVLSLVLLILWHGARKMIAGRGERAHPLVPFLFVAAAMTAWL